MPSGGHGGGGGGHSGGSSGGGGGGSHFGGGSGGFGFGGGRPSGMRHGMHVHFYHFGGRRYYMGSGPSGAASFLITFAIFLAFIAVILFIIPTDTGIKKIENDHERYIAMIEYADEHPDYYIMGQVVSKYEYEDTGKYYITYKFKVPGTTKYVEGFSYSVYTLAQASQLVHDYSGEETFKIALEMSKTNITASNYLSVDSVNEDYRNYSLNDDVEYVSAINSAKTTKIVRIVLVVVSVGFVVVSIVLFKNGLKRDDGEPVKGAVKSVENKQEERRCKYCGSALKEGETKCKNCGGTYK